MRIVQYLGVFALAALLLFIFGANFSSVESRFECSGAFARKDDTQPATIYIKLEEYRSRVGLWSDSDGTLWIEVPNEWVDVYFDLSKKGEQIQIYDDDKKLKGNFSTLSKTLALSTHRGFFDGVCKQND